MDMTNLEPNILFCQRPRWILNNIFEALYDESATARSEEKLVIYLQTLVVFLLLFIYYSETKVNFIRLLEVWLHVHDLREGLFGMFKRAVTVIQYANSVP